MLRRCFSTAFALVVLLTATASLRAADVDQVPIVVEDPHYGEALFYFYQEDYFPAIVRILAAESQEQLESHADDAELLLGGMYLSYGHHLESSRIFEKLLAANVSTETRDRTWFFLAKIWYQRGYVDKAEKALGLIEGELPENLQREALSIHAQILIGSERFDEAIALLGDWNGKTEWASYAKFNIGVALVRSGQIEAAHEILSELGDIRPYNDELAALRDKANLALGYALLQEGQQEAAKASLQRVRLEGPFSNKALLGVGWADAELNDYQRALVPWMELEGRDLLDPAVQESMLAIPYAMAKLESINQAADYYEKSITLFYDETARLDQAITRIESGEMFDEFLVSDPTGGTGWYWQLADLPSGPEARYLFHLLAQHEFQEGLKNFRDLNFLYRNLDSWQGSVDVYRNMLETRKQAYDERLPRVEDALARADLDGMVNRKLELDSTLNSVEKSHDWLALASKYEFELWGEITGLEASPALRADIPEARQVRDKIKLLKGVLQWELERDFKTRLRTVRRNLNETGQALVETQRSRRQIDETLQNEPLLFAAMTDRVDSLAPRIEGMKMRVNDALVAQRGFLQTIAVGELQAQKERLNIYTLQARFALAAIYDVSAMSAGDVR